MELIYRLDVRVSAPTKTTTRVVMEALGVKVERSAGSVQRALEETLTEFAHLLRAPLLKEARAARAQEEPLGPRVEIDKPAPPEEEEEVPAGPLPDRMPSLFSEGSGILATITPQVPKGNVSVEPFAPPVGSEGSTAGAPLVLHTETQAVYSPDEEAREARERRP